MGAKCREAKAQKAKYELSGANLEEAERRMLSFSGLPDDQIRIENVKVGNYKNEDVYVHTLILGDENPEKPIMVLCHGYGGSGALFYKVMAPLCERFRLITFDLIGMGGSSRPKDFKINKFNAEQSLDYFINYIEQWRQVMKLDQFVLACHSFGGFVCGNYATRYP
jgi:pimeloyl-ACP methyl ester carboxylesterase